jgi:hypothetical protein
LRLIRGFDPIGICHVESIGVGDVAGFTNLLGQRRQDGVTRRAQAGIGQYPDGNIMQAIAWHVTFAVDFLQQVTTRLEFGAESMCGRLWQVQHFVNFGSADRFW